MASKGSAGLSGGPSAARRSVPGHKKRAPTRKIRNMEEARFMIDCQTIQSA